MRIIILIIILAVAVGLGMLWMSGSPGTAQTGAPVAQQRTTGDVATVDVLVARDDITVGSAITENLIDRQPWPRNLVLDGFITADSKDVNVINTLARADFKAREPLILSKLAQPGDATFLGSSLGKGMRAVTVAVDAVAGVAGFILPGDRVDVLFTHSVPQEAAVQLFGDNSVAVGRKPTTAEVLMPNLKILAVNTRTAPPKKDPQGNTPPPEVHPPANVTLEMTQEDAKKLRLAEKNGTLSLALRPVSEKDNFDVGSPVTVLDISRVEGGLTNVKNWGWRKNSQSLQEYGDEVLIIRGITEVRAPEWKREMQENNANAGVMEGQ